MAVQGSTRFRVYRLNTYAVFIKRTFINIANKFDFEKHTMEGAV